MPLDLAVVGRDPLFGDGSVAQTQAFADAARSLGRDPVMLFDGHPGLRGPRLTWRRVEVLRQETAARRLPDLGAARDVWVVATHATDGLPALAAGRPYSCWIGTTTASEWQGRAPLLPAPRRLVGSVNVPFLRRIERQVVEGAAAVYATSETTRRELADETGRDDIGILRIPIDTNHFTPAPAEAWARAVADRVVVFVGRGDDARKNVGLLVASARRLPDLRVLLVGTRPRLELPANVEAVGRVADVASVLHRAGLFVLPSRQEGFGIAAAEALAAGLPVVSTPSGGPEEMLRKSSAGVVTRTFDAEELAATIDSLFARPDELDGMRTRGRAYVEAFHSHGRFVRDVDEALGRSG